MSSKWTDALRHAFTLRLGVWYAALFASSAAALLVVTYSLLGRALATQDHEVLASTLARYAAEYQRAGLEGLRTLVDADESEGRHERLLLRVVSPQKELIYFSQPPGWSAFDLSALDDPAATRAGWLLIGNSRDQSVLEVGTVGLANGVAVQVGRSSHVRDELLANFRAGAFEVAGVLALLAASGGLVITYLALAPVRAMQATTSTILRTRRFEARVPTQGTRDPLDQLGARVNDMLAQIEALILGMKGALDNIAHDLRTPLTRFRNIADAALASEDPADVKEGLISAVQESDRLGATLTALIDVSEVEAGTLSLQRESISLADCVTEAVSLHEDEAEERRLVLTAAVDPSITVLADRTRLRQVLANLIENAVKYTEPGGTITIGAEAMATQVVVNVRDTGVGIGPDDLPLVWDRLYRADRSRKARGLGLGLSLVKAIVEAHGGRVSASSVLGEGSTFTITLQTDAGRSDRPASVS
jgi:signal transduction histidine kinase